MRKFFHSPGWGGRTLATNYSHQFNLSNSICTSLVWKQRQEETTQIAQFIGLFQPRMLSHHLILFVVWPLALLVGGGFVQHWFHRRPSKFQCTSLSLLWGGGTVFFSRCKREKHEHLKKHRGPYITKIGIQHSTTSNPNSVCSQQRVQFNSNRKTQWTATEINTHAPSLLLYPISIYAKTFTGKT